MIELESVTKTYKGSVTPAVKDISFVCADSCVTGLLGPNGAGKTTLIRAICGLHLPDSGKISVNGISLDGHIGDIQRMTGFVSENAVFPEQYLVSELLDEHARIRHEAGNLKKSPSQAIADAVSQFSLEAVFSKKIRTLSKGYRQRLSFALAMLHDPDILILDEPVTGLDPLQIVEIRQLIRKLSEQKTILLSTHLMQEAESVCDTLVILHEGQLIAKGTAAEICAGTSAKSLEDAFVNLVQQRSLS